ncbi:MAG: hypothetical protein AAF990_24325 [Bacteroidota bacterium]
MYEQLIAPFGAYDKYTFYNPASGHLMSLVPGCGACLVDLILDNQSLLDTYQTAEQLEMHKKAKSEFLLPFPNRLLDGLYTFEGKTYQFPINNKPTANAIHGFAIGEPMSLEKVELAEQKVQLVCLFDYDGSREYYPFPFKASIEFELSDSDGLTIGVFVENTGTGAMPIGMGWHPYFKIGTMVDDWYLQVPASQVVAIDDRMIPTGVLTPYTKFQRLERIGASTLDNCFLLEDREEAGQAEVLLTNVNQGRTLRYWQECGPGKFNYIQLFIPPPRQSIAIEPMSCNINAFNNGNGLTVLQAGEKAGGRFGVQLL